MMPAIAPRIVGTLRGVQPYELPRNDGAIIYCDWLCHWPGRPACSTLTATVSVSVPPP